MAKKKLKKCIKGDYWEVDETIHPHKGIIISKYYYKGVRAIQIPLEGHIANQMAGYTLIHHDIRMIILWIKNVIDEHKKIGLDKAKQTVVRITPVEIQEKMDDLKALMAASFSFYGKLFTKAEGRKIKLDKNIFKDSQKYLDIHNELMSCRHNFVAHSGKERMEYVEVSLILDSKKERNTRPIIARILNQPNAFSMQFLKNFLEINEYLLDKIQHKLDSLDRAFYKDLSPDRLHLYYEVAKM